MSTNGKTLKFRAAKLKGFTVYEDKQGHCDVASVYLVDLHQEKLNNTILAGMLRFIFFSFLVLINSLHH